MADTLPRMTTAEFLAWEARQPGRHEFVRGRIVAMVGGTRRHNAIGARVLAFLLSRLRGRSCQPYGADMKILIPSGNSRYADVVVDCGPMKDEDIAAAEPTVVVEVLSNSTSYADQTEKLDDYQSIPSMRHIVHLSQDRVAGEVWTRVGGEWKRTSLQGRDAEADLAAIGVTLPLSVAYEGVTFTEDEAS